VAICITIPDFRHRNDPRNGSPPWAELTEIGKGKRCIFISRLGPSKLGDVPLENAINVRITSDVFLPVRALLLGFGGSPQYSCSFGAIRYQYHRHFV
jgi:hypothetical protein